MAFSRYAVDRANPDNNSLRISVACSNLRTAIRDGQVAITQTLTLTQADRLDHLAGALYGDSRYWWVLAAASNIGWGMQAPPGTVIFVPDLRQVELVIA